MFVFLLALSACRKDRIEEDTSDRLKSVTVLGAEVVLPRDGTAEISFRIADPGFSFNYNVSSSYCQVRLLRRDGSAPDCFRLHNVLGGGQPGLYTAVLKDSGAGQDYKEEVCITIVQFGAGGESYVASSYLTVRSETEQYSVLVETGLPVIYIDTENGKAVTSKTVEVPAVLKVKGAGAYSDQPQVNCTIRGRGNTTWSWPKKPYLVKLENRLKMLGMPEHKRWVLLANFMDRTLMRNLVSMKVASLTALEWTPRCVPVELVLNGRHVGSYLLIEQVRVDENRLDISEDRGWLLELDFHYDNEIQWHDHGIPFGIKYPDPDDITKDQINYIRKHIAEVANTIYGASFADPETGYARWIDVDSFVDYWILYEVMGNHELGNPGSVFFHMEEGGKIYAGPPWDFDWGILSYNTSPHAKTGFVNMNAIWYSRLFKDPAFRTRVRERFRELLPALQTIPAYIDECEALLEESARLNFAMWDPAGDASMNGGHIINGDERMSYADAVARLRSIYEERLKVIGDNL